MLNTQETSRPSQKLVRELSASLHELAQPLSIIQSSLELAIARQMTVPEYREMAENALQQMSSVLDSMHFLTQLVRVQQPANDTIKVKLSEAVHGALQEMNRTLEAAKITPSLLPQEEVAIYISKGRLKQMLFSVFQAAAKFSPPGSVLHIVIQRNAQRMELRIHSVKDGNAPAGGPEAHGEARIRTFSLADAIVSSAGGDFVASASPFCIFADFPIMETSEQQAVPVSGQDYESALGKILK